MTVTGLFSSDILRLRLQFRQHLFARGCKRGGIQIRKTWSPSSSSSPLTSELLFQVASENLLLGLGLVSPMSSDEDATKLSKNHWPVSLPVT